MRIKTKLEQLSRDIFDDVLNNVSNKSSEKLNKPAFA